MPITLSLFHPSALRGQAFGNSVRMLSALPLAAIITIGLFILMHNMVMIAVPQTEQTGYDPIPKINWQPKETEVHKRTEPKKVDPVKLPPVPVLPKAPAAQPTESIAPVTGSIPDFGPANIASVSPNFTVTNRDEQPIVRVSPIYPLSANGRTATCDVRFSLNEKGVPFNIVPNCSASVFERPVSRAVAKWKYAPKLVDGQPVVRHGMRTSIVFKSE